MTAEPRTRAASRLGRAVRATLEGGHPALRHAERHPQGNWLRDVILGGQDGLVNILGIILGVIAGGGSDTVLLAAGFRRGDHRVDLDGRRRLHLVDLRARLLRGREGARDRPRSTRCRRLSGEEIREIYAAKGFSGQLLDDVVRHDHRQPRNVAGDDDGRGAAPPADPDARHPADLGRHRDRHAHRPPDPARCRSSCCRARRPWSWRSC